MAKHKEYRIGKWNVDEWSYRAGARTVLFIPGYSEPAASFKRIARHPLLKKARTNVVLAAVPGNEGYPLGSRNRGNGFAHLARSIKDLVDEVKPDLIVGHSLGSNVAIEYAYSDDYRGPLLLIGAPFKYMKTRWIEVVEKVGLPLKPTHKAGWQATIAACRAWRASGAAQDTKYWVFVDAWADSDADDLTWLYHAHDKYLKKSPSQIERLRRAGNPTYLLYGKDEQREPGKKELRRSPNVTALRSINGGHPLRTMSQQKVARHVLAILDQHQPTLNPERPGGDDATELGDPPSDSPA